ncbi:alpha/beta hydrolase [Arthrobacter sp. RIT-PI-e]|uniref:alpha/beta hydrolase n=1 Tax=Arthrobacter sp. RIT-PI-e TaxID=1681197 RepID=UPI000675E7AB|nr:alpha/beta hydrolase [Arthrobacter sp. RIT-PI-e]KNC19487.1 alpha/beta hydrolase [Arthrobacter sp. RIT-PI-e]
MSVFHPDLSAGRWIPKFSFGPRLARLANRPREATADVPADLLVEDIAVPGPEGAPDVNLRLIRPRTSKGAAPALLWLHGGGMILGTNAQDDATNFAFARTLGITVVSVEYRLSPQHVAPAALEDAYTALTWLVAHAEERGVDPDRIAVGGQSAGGGIAAGLALLAHDRGEVHPAFQLLVYPMIDDRTVTRTDLDTRNVRVWTPGSNRFGWTSYLGRAPGSAGVSPYAAPARREDLSGLPPAWIGVGTLDLFLDEDTTYAARLEEAGTPCELVIVEGAFHGFDALFGKKPVSKEFRAAQIAALQNALFANSDR